MNQEREARSFRRMILSTATCLLLAACATKPHNVDPEGMSAEAHRRVAAHEEKIAKAHEEILARKSIEEGGEERITGVAPVESLEDLSLVDPESIFPVYWRVERYDPGRAYRKLIETHRERARLHLEAARALEAFTEATCAQFPPETREICPLQATVASIENFDRGVRVKIKEGFPLAAVMAHLECHHAFARQQGYRGMEGCPLYLRGIVIERVGNAIEITAEDRVVIEAIQDRMATHRIVMP